MHAKQILRGKTLEWEKTAVPLEGERNHYESLMVYTLRSLIQ